MEFREGAGSGRSFEGDQTRNTRRQQHRGRRGGHIYHLRCIERVGC